MQQQALARSDLTLACEVVRQNSDAQTCLYTFAPAAAINDLQQSHCYVVFELRKLIISGPSLDTLMALLCIVNSSVAAFYLRERYPASSYNQGITYTKEMLNDLPLPEISSEQWNRLATLARKTIALKRSNSAADTSGMERENNELVADLYRLTQSERESIMRES